MASNLAKPLKSYRFYVFYMHNNYFEGILQLRNPNSDIIRFIESRIGSEKGVFIAKKINVTNGIDFYISSRKYLHKLGKLLKSQFCGELKLSPKLFTRNKQTSKNVYRVNVLFRVCDVKKGDIITVRGEGIRVISLGKKLFGKVVNTNKKVCVDYSELK